jgi:hypothetical protein
MPAQAAAVRREHVEAYLADLASVRSASTVATRYRGLQHCSRQFDRDAPDFRSRPGEVIAESRGRRAGVRVIGVSR